MKAMLEEQTELSGLLSKRRNIQPLREYGFEYHFQFVFYIPCNTG
jgi:hypothetical protein